MENETFDKVNTWIGESFELSQFSYVKFHEKLDKNATGFDFKDALDLGLARIKSKLTVSEAMLILDAINCFYADGYLLKLAPKITVGLVLIVSDAIYLDGLDVKWKVDEQALLNKLSGLSYLEAWALLDWVSRSDGEVDLAGFLKEGVAKE